MAEKSFSEQLAENALIEAVEGLGSVTEEHMLANGLDSVKHQMLVKGVFSIAGPAVTASEALEMARDGASPRDWFVFGTGKVCGWLGASVGGIGGTALGGPPVGFGGAVLVGAASERAGEELGAAVWDADIIGKSTRAVSGLPAEIERGVIEAVFAANHGFVPDELFAGFNKCFPAGTQVRLADARRVAIEDVRVGDVVAAFNGDETLGRGVAVGKRVVRLFENITDTWIVLSNGLTVTPGHHFLDSRGGFRTIEDILRTDGVIILEDGSEAKVTGEYIRYSDVTAHLFEQSEGSATATAGGLALAPVHKKGWKTYNFEVEHFHTYIAGGVRVHNESYDFVSKATGEKLFPEVVSRFDPDTNTWGKAVVWRPADQLSTAPATTVGQIRPTDGSSGTRVFNPDTSMWETVQAPGANTGSSPTIGGTLSDKPSTIDLDPSPDSGNSGGSLIDNDSSGDSGHADGSSPSSATSDKPVLIDLDGDGVEIATLDSSNMFFDMAGDGMQHRTAWAGAGDGVLVRDAGDDGIIEHRNEVDFTEWDSTARTDLEALRNLFDSNHDGVLNASDADWSLFKVLVTNADGTTTLKTMSELGITSINLISNNQEIVLPDGSKIIGTTSYTRSDGSTGTAADAALSYDPLGYVVTQTVTTNADGSTTIVNTAARPDGSVASETTSTMSAGGFSRTISFDNNGDGVVDRVQTDVTVLNADGSRTNTLSDYDGSGTILARRQVTVTSADGKTVTVSRDLDGSGNFDLIETRVTGADGSLTLSVTQLNADGSVNNETTTITSADGHSKITQVELTGSGAVNASRVETTSIAADGTRTETVSNYVGSGTGAGNRVGSSVTVTSGDGTGKTVTSDLDGDGDTDLTTASTIVHNANGSTTTTVNRYNGDGSLRDRSVTDRSADGNSKTTTADVDGDGANDMTTTDVTVFNADGSTTRTLTNTYADGSRQDQTVGTWSADGKTRTTSIDSDGDGAFDRVEAVAIVGTDSVDTASVYSGNGVTLLSRSVANTSADGLTQTTQVDANGDGAFDSTQLVSKVLNADNSSTVTVVTRNGDGTVQIRKTVTTTSADGLSKTTQSYLGTAALPHSTVTDVTVQAGALAAPVLTAPAGST